MVWFNSVVFIINFAKILIDIYKDIYFKNNLSTALPVLDWASFKVDFFWTVRLPLKNMRILTNSDKFWRYEKYWFWACLDD